MLRGAESAGRRVHCGLRPTPDHQSEVTRGSVSTPPPQGVPRISRSPLEPRPGPAGLLTRRWKQTGLTRATSAASGCERKRPTQGAGVNCYPEASERVRRCARAPTSDVMQRSANDDRRGAMIWYPIDKLPSKSSEPMLFVKHGASVSRNLRGDGSIDLKGTSGPSCD